MGYQDILRFVKQLMIWYRFYHCRPALLSLDLFLTYLNTQAPFDLFQIAGKQSLPSHSDPVQSQIEHCYYTDCIPHRKEGAVFYLKLYADQLSYRINKDNGVKLKNRLSSIYTDYGIDSIIFQNMKKVPYISCN